MAQPAAHWVDHALPHVPVRQWVLPLPIPPRLLLAAERPVVEFHADACGSQGALFVNGQLVGHLVGVSRP
jgi:hypothetical protein